MKQSKETSFCVHGPSVVIEGVRIWGWRNLIEMRPGISTVGGFIYMYKKTIWWSSVGHLIKHWPLLIDTSRSLQVGTCMCVCVRWRMGIRGAGTRGGGLELVPPVWLGHHLLFQTQNVVVISHKTQGLITHNTGGVICWSKWRPVDNC